MSNSHFAIIDRIKSMARTAIDRFPVVSQSEIQETECKLGFALPPLLVACFMQVANGGFGPSDGVIGIKNGYKSVFGDICATYTRIQQDMRSIGSAISNHLVPFVDWGCNQYSCVDCNDPPNAVYTLDSGKLYATQIALDDFFRLWTQGVDVLWHGATYEESGHDFPNPFKPGNITINARKRTE